MRDTPAHQTPTLPDPVLDRLATPTDAATMDELLASWFHADVVTLCQPPRGWTAADLAKDFALPGRLRGAWGQQLLRMASLPAQRGEPCPWSPPCPYDPLFRERPPRGGLEFPKPYTIAVDPGPDGTVALRLTLFGFATDWLENAAEAWTQGLRNGVGMPDGLQAALEPIDRRLTVREHLPQPAVPPAAILRFVTPLNLRRGGVVHSDITSLFSSLSSRVCGMARWLDCAVTIDRDELRARAASLSIDNGHLQMVSWQRWSRRQGNTPIQMDGLVGPMVIAGDLAPFWPLLLAGQSCHAGSHSAQGLGRYRLEPLGE
ncbi:CRISPR system precrRNA processing endoribonuclease RAMP protein Cas6 [Insolitispirillum peregrinum]|uniref:Uncharacterized conserved protein n=1 Tax=Insolitispirillum peregrinum TaxID=80876 RepID=A0A1N7IIF9_9PROT|nr:CRISPR system precrRNA processing endoribonuclease RAMP protein Cas6 [Insolitispirillum peregrinum]SIS36771.1 Uncharacterized conserved protein [Insolitispirillum peregrinum]